VAWVYFPAVLALGLLSTTDRQLKIAAVQCYRRWATWASTIMDNDFVQ